MGFPSTAVIHTYTEYTWTNPYININNTCYLPTAATCITLQKEWATYIKNLLHTAGVECLYFSKINCKSVD